MIISGFILIGNLHYISFFEEKNLRYNYLKGLRFVTIGKNIRNNNDIKLIRY